MPAPSSQTYSDDRTRTGRKRLRPADVITRAAVAELLRRSIRHNELEDRADTVARIYDCPATLHYVARAATSPASTTVAGWAAELVQSSIADFLSGPQSVFAFGALAEKATSITLPPGVYSIGIPSRASPQVLVGSWVAENGAKPVNTIPLTTVNLLRFKLAAISVFSEELLMHSTPSIEAVVRDVLQHDLGGLLDSSLLDSAAASAVRPAGLFQGVTPLTASALTPTSEAMAKDLAALAGAVSTGAPDARVTFLANPAQAARMVASGYETISTGFLAAGSVAAVDAASIAMTADPPVFALSRDATLHESDVPLALGTGAQGSGVLAVPMRSTFQTDTVAIRSSLRAGWVRRRSGCTAIVTGATW